MIISGIPSCVDTQLSWQARLQKQVGDIRLPSTICFDHPTIKDIVTYLEGLNACLDALAQSRLSQGLRVISIQWGAWAGAGMASSWNGKYGVVVCTDPAVHP